jgi:threonine/homoserine/homoserine lactone efflux protein
MRERTMRVAPLIIAFLPFAVAMSFTPGPNNLMLASAGARFGFARTLPQQAGVVIGFAIMTLAIGFGIAALVTAVPTLFLVMRIASIAYILYLAWKIATADSIKATPAESRPLGFFHMAAFQWVNPKAWMMALGAVTTYTTPAADFHLQILLIVLVLAVVGVASTSVWVLFGQLIRRYLTTPRRRIAFNWTMAGLLILSVAPVLIERT